MTPQEERDERDKKEEIAAALLLAFLLKQAFTIRHMLLSGNPINLPHDELKAILMKAGDMGAQIIADNSITDPQVVRLLMDSGYIEHAAEKAAIQMNDTTVRKVRYAIDQLSFNENLEPTQTPLNEKAVHVENELKKIAVYRATNAAGNMVVDGAEGLKHLIVNSGTKTWHSMGDKKVRPTHQIADGQTVRSDQHFEVGADLLMFPRDPEGSSSEIAGCRCVSSYSQRW